MIKNKLFTLMATATMMAPAALSTPVSAATTAPKPAVVKIKKNSKLYYLKLNKGQTKVNKVLKYKLKGRQLAVKGGTSKAFWSVKRGKTTYYYLGNQKGKMLAVRAKDTTKKRGNVILSLAKYIKAHMTSKNVKVPVKHIDIASLAMNAKTKTATIYGEVDSNGKIQTAQTQLPANTDVAVLFKIDNLFNSNQGASKAGYYAKMGDKTIVLPADSVNLNEAEVPDQTTFEQTVKDKDAAYVKQQVEQYKQDHNIK